MQRSSTSLRLLLLLSVVSLTGCGQTLFQSNFDQTATGQAPAVTQTKGTAHADGPAGSVTVVDPPVTPSPKWVQISRPADNVSVAGMQGKFDQKAGDGRYSFTATMFMPKSAGVATIQFEPFSNGPSDLLGFFHLDFTEDGRVQLDDIESTTFGQFVRDQPFIVQVDLDINATASTASISLSGAAVGGQQTSGSTTYTLQTAFRTLSSEFGAIRIWQGHPHTGAFQATNIVVKRKS